MNIEKRKPTIFGVHIIVMISPRFDVEFTPKRRRRMYVPRIYILYFIHIVCVYLRIRAHYTLWLPCCGVARTMTHSVMNTFVVITRVTKEREK